MGSLSLADLAFVPTIMRIFSHVAVPTRWAEAATWMDLLLQRTSVVEWMEDARGLDPVYLPDYRDGRRV
jgi:glutathione S-transferase